MRQLLLGLVLGLSLAGGAIGQARKITVVTGGAAPNAAFVPIYVAQHAGIFSAEGIDVDFQYSSGAPVAAQLASVGQADIAMITAEPVIYGHEKGLKGKMFLRINNRLIYYIAVPAASPIKTVQDLKGKKIGVVSLGAAAVPVAKSIMREGGVEPTSDQFVPVGVGEQAMTALRTNNVQALALFSGIYFGMERSGNQLRYLSHPKFSGLGTSMLFASDNARTQKKNELCAFGRAYAKAMLFAQENPEAAVRLYWKVSPTAKRGDSDAQALANGVQEVRQLLTEQEGVYPPQGRFGTVNTDMMNAYMAMLKQEGVVNQLPALGEILDTGFSDCINAFDGEAVKKMAREWKQ